MDLSCLRGNMGRERHYWGTEVYSKTPHSCQQYQDQTQYKQLQRYPTQALGTKPPHLRCISAEINSSPGVH